MIMILGVLFLVAWLGCKKPTPSENDKYTVRGKVETRSFPDETRTGITSPVLLLNSSTSEAELLSNEVNANDKSYV